MGLNKELTSSETGETEYCSVQRSINSSKYEGLFSNKKNLNKLNNIIVDMRSSYEIQ